MGPTSSWKRVAMRRAICGVMSGGNATSCPELGSTKRMAASRPALPRPSASTSSYSKTGVMTRAYPQRSKTASERSAMRRRAAAASGAKSRIPAGSRSVVRLSMALARSYVRAGRLQLIDRVADLAALQELDEDLGQLDRHLLLRFLGRSAGVRREQDVVELEEGQRRGRLFLEDVEGSAAEVAGLERLVERGFVH